MRVVGPQLDQQLGGARGGGPLLRSNASAASAQSGSRLPLADCVGTALSEAVSMPMVLKTWRELVSVP